MRVVLFGTGAMSCLFGARLAAVAQIALVGSWADAIAAVRQRGIVVQESQELWTAAVQAEYLGMNPERADLVIVLVKSWQTGKVAGHLPEHLKRETPVVSLQNGLGNVEALGAMVSPGATAEGATLLGPGRVCVGGRGPTHVVAPEWVVDILRSAGFETYRCDPQEAESLMWGKLVVSCGINALTALLRISNGELLTRPGAPDLMLRATMECASVARAKGIELPFADPVAHVQDVARRTKCNRSSMLQDVLRGAPTECDAINGAVVREGRRLGVPTPVNEVLWRLVRAATQYTSDSEDEEN